MSTTGIKWLISGMLFKHKVQAAKRRKKLKKMRPRTRVITIKIR